MAKDKQGSYLFSLDLKYKQYLKDGSISNELRKAFENELSLSDKAKINKEDDKHWKIESGSKTYKIEDDGAKLKIYSGLKNKKNKNQIRGEQLFTFYILLLILSILLYGVLHVTLYNGGGYYGSDFLTTELSENIIKLENLAYLSNRTVEKDNAIKLLEYTKDRILSLNADSSKRINEIFVNTTDKIRKSDAYGEYNSIINKSDIYEILNETKDLITASNFSNEKINRYFDEAEKNVSYLQGNRNMILNITSVIGETIEKLNNTRMYPDLNKTYGKLKTKVNEDKIDTELILEYTQQLKEKTNEKGKFLWYFNYRIWIEILFWSLFGTLVYGLWNIQDWIRRGDGEFMAYTYWYISKIMIGPIIALVIMFFLMNVEIGGVSFKDTSVEIMLGISFILGYYGNTARQYLDIIKDKYFPGELRPPIIEITKPKDKTITNKEDLTVKGRIYDDYGIRFSALQLNEVNIEELSQGEFEKNVKLKNGENTITINVTNEKGKTAAKSITVTYKE